MLVKGKIVGATVMVCANALGDRRKDDKHVNHMESVAEESLLRKVAEKEGRKTLSLVGLILALQDSPDKKHSHEH